MVNVFNNKVVLVTGAGSGIGRATAIMFSQKGARVAIADMNFEAAENTARIIEQNGGTAYPFKIDVRNAVQVKSLINGTREKFGSLDIAFNNAGILVKEWVRMADESNSVFDAIIDTNLKGVRLCLKYEIQAMLEQGGGVIINNASISGINPSPNQTSYCASKHAVMGLSNSACLEYASDNIRITAICAGWVDTPLVSPLTSVPENNQVINNQVPAGRLASPEEIAELVTWLASDAASYIWGGGFPICGALGI